MELLVAAGASVRQKDRLGGSAMHYAFQGGHHHIVKFLMNCDATAAFCITDDGSTPLHFAFLSEDPIPSIRHLLKAGLSIDQRDHKGRTPLHYAASGNNLAVVRELLSQGANPKWAFGAATEPNCSKLLLKAVDASRENFLKRFTVFTLLPQ